MITVRMVKYSTPAHLIGLRVRVSLRSSQVVVFDGRTVVATHPRVAARTGHRVVLDHYLEVLRYKPDALPGSTALAQARAAGASPPPMRRSGLARSTATRTAPVSGSTCSYCTGP